MKFIGIDLAKSSFVAAFPQEGGYRTTTYKNRPLAKPSKDYIVLKTV